MRICAHAMPRWWTMFFSKAAQITKAQASLSPCRFCQREFKTTHMCPVLTQSALLLVNLYDPGDARHQQMVLTCEICQEEFEDDSALHRHLSAVHRLAYEDRRPERHDGR